MCGDSCGRQCLFNTARQTYTYALGADVRNRAQVLAETSQMCAKMVRDISLLAAWPFTRIGNKLLPISSIFGELVTCTI